MLVTTGSGSSNDGTVDVDDQTLTITITGVDDAVATAGLLTIVQAGVVLVLVAVIADLSAHPEHTVTAFGNRTVVSTPIGLYLIAIVTGLIPYIARLQVETTMSVAASRQFTRDTVIGVDPIGIVARLAIEHVGFAITTERKAAPVGAVIAVDSVAIVAFFHAPPDDAVTTAGHQTFAGACIGF